MKRIASLFRVPNGFTLVEMVVVIAIAAIVAAMIGSFLRFPMNAYVDTERRTVLTEAADTALRRIARELRTALPNSVRVTAVGGTTYLEFIPTVGGGRYRNYPTIGGGGDLLDFTTGDTAFDVLGPVPVYAAGNSIVVFNLGPGTVADAYAGTNRAAVTSGNNAMPGAPALFSTDPPGQHTVTFTVRQFPLPSPASLFQMVTPPVTYACTPNAATPATGTLVRYASYGFAAMQPTPPAVTPVTVVNGVSACTIAYDPVVLRVRTALVTLAVDLSEAGETIRMVHQMHVQNSP